MHRHPKGPKNVWKCKLALVQRWHDRGEWDLLKVVDLLEGDVDIPFAAVFRPPSRAGHRTRGFEPETPKRSAVAASWAAGAAAKIRNSVMLKLRSPFAFYEVG